MIRQKKPPKCLTAGVLEFLSLDRRNLHSHTYYANTHLFKKFIAKFIAESDETRRVQEG